MNTILFISGAVILFIVLAMRFRKAIILTFLRMIYGQYSYEFLSTYKKFFVRSPFQYCFRDEFIAHLLFVLSKKDDIPTFKSHQEIYFENTPYFIQYKEFLKKKGNPYCFNAFIFHQYEFEIKALGYQEVIAGSKAVTVFYFMNDSFFMGEYIFKNPKTDIKSSLVKHFLGLEEVPADNFYIDNTKKRLVHYQDTGFTVDIKYFNMEDEGIIQNLKGYYKIATGKKTADKKPN